MKAIALVDRARRLTRDALASLRRSESTTVTFENDRLKSVNVAQNTHAEIRVNVEGRIGASHTTDRDDAEGVVHRAVEAAAFGAPARFSWPGLAPTPSVIVHDPAVEALSKNDLIRIGEAMMARLKAYRGDILTEASLAKSVGHTEIATAAGAFLALDSTAFSLYVGGQWIRGTDILSAGNSATRRDATIDHEAVAERAVEWFRHAERLTTVESGEMPVIFTPAGLNVLLLSLVLGVNGKNVATGDSPLSGRLGDRIASHAFTLLDDPLIDGAPGSAPFDAEAVPRRALPIIECGALTNFLFDLDAAARMREASNGHGRGCSPTNLVIAPGKTPFARMLADAGSGLLVHEFLGLGQGNALSGAFSVNVQLGYKIEHGEIVGRVKDVMLAGNVYEVLDRIVAIGDTPEWTDGPGCACLAPPIQVDGLNVTAR